MIRNHEKFIFLFAVIGAIFFARLVYPNLSGVPSLADTAQTQGQEPSRAAKNPPALVLPQTSVSADAQPGSTATDTLSGADQETNTSQIPSFASAAYLVAGLSTGNVYAGSNAARRWPTASITKLMTATLVFDQLPMDTRITITPQMFAADPDERILMIGDTYTVKDLLHLLLMPSSNVAAEAMAAYIGRAQFMNEMNQRAREWGMTNTYFDDPSGISAANQSSGNDLMILAQHMYKDYPGILSLTDTPAAAITELNSGRTTTVRSINVFAGEPAFIGGKTGNTPQAGGNLLSIFNDRGTPILVIVLGAPALPFQDTSMLYSWYQKNYQ